MTVDHGWAARVAAYGLPAAADSFPADPLDPRDWQRLLSTVRAQRLEGFLLDAVADGALPATPEQLEEACDAHVAAMCSVLLLERDLLSVVEPLDRAGVDHRVLKGSAIARLDYPDPSLRSFGDVDLLVRADEFDSAVETLTGEGYERRFPQPRPGFDREFSKGTSFLMPSRHELDLHRTFVLGPFGFTVRLDDVWSRSTPFEIGGRWLHALAAEERFLNACLHAALGDYPPRLVPLRDVAQLLCSGSLDLDTVRERVEGWRAAAVVARAVTEAWDTLEVSSTNPLVEWARAYEPQPWERRAMAPYLDGRQSYAAKSLAMLRVIPGVSRKAAYLRALALPDGSYLDGRHASRRRRWRHGLRAISHRAAIR